MPVHRPDWRTLWLFIYVNRDSLVVWQATGHKALQKNISVALRPCVLYLSYCPTLAGHPREYVCTTQWETTSFAYIWRTPYIRRWRTATYALRMNLKRSKNVGLSSYQQENHLSFWSYIFWDHFQKTPLGSQHVVSTKDGYSKLPYPISAEKITAMHLVTIFHDNWTLPYGHSKLCKDQKRPRLSVNSSGRYVISEGLKSWRPPPIICQ